MDAEERVMPVLTAVLDLAVRVEGDAARAAAVLEAAEGVMARAEVRVLALPPAERTAAAGRLARARSLLDRARRQVQQGDIDREAWLTVGEAVLLAEGVAPPPPGASGKLQTDGTH